MIFFGLLFLNFLKQLIVINFYENDRVILTKDFYDERNTSVFLIKKDLTFLFAFIENINLQDHTTFIVMIDEIIIGFKKIELNAILVILLKLKTYMLLIKKN